MVTILLVASADFWVFAYGSLIWNPGFAYKSCEPVTLIGYHRAYCIASMVYRGTPEQPGLVLGLEAGGSCEGLGYRVAGEHRSETLSYLRERELITSVYHEKLLAVATRSGEAHQAFAYVADPGHAQYVAACEFDEMIETIATANGTAGPNGDYALNTAANLQALGIRDPLIEQVAEALKGRA